MRTVAPPIVKGSSDFDVGTSLTEREWGSIRGELSGADTRYCISVGYHYHATLAAQTQVWMMKIRKAGGAQPSSCDHHSGRDQQWRLLLSSRSFKSRVQWKRRWRRNDIAVHYTHSMIMKRPREVEGPEMAPVFTGSVVPMITMVEVK